uniref:Uncharacterized protein n=1 Tax=uncultured bacterium SM321_p TaxID=1552130 RepID=A0A0K0LBG4_9BACT|nr:hypothetical protein [uncultured bacterium SM321_p]
MSVPGPIDMRASGSAYSTSGSALSASSSRCNCAGSSVGSIDTTSAPTASRRSHVTVPGTPLASTRPAPRALAAMRSATSAGSRSGALPGT